MALSESAVEELLAALAVGEGTDLVRELAGWALQELIELEAVEAIGADRWERSAGSAHASQWVSAAGVVDQGGGSAGGDPEVSQGFVLPGDSRTPTAHRPGLVRGGDGGLRQRREHTRSVDDLVVAMGIDTGISKSEVSRICAGLDDTGCGVPGSHAGTCRVPVCLS